MTTRKGYRKKNSKSPDREYKCHGRDFYVWKGKQPVVRHFLHPFTRSGFVRLSGRQAVGLPKEQRATARQDGRQDARRQTFLLPFSVCRKADTSRISHKRPPELQTKVQHQDYNFSHQTFGRVNNNADLCRNLFTNKHLIRHESQNRSKGIE